MGIWRHDRPYRGCGNHGGLSHGEVGEEGVVGQVRVEVGHR